MIRKRPGRAAAWLAAAVALVGAGCGSSATALHGEALDALEEGRLDGAVQLFRRAIEAQPEDEIVHRDYQNLMRRLNRLDDVRAEYRAWVAAEPRSPRALYLYGRLHEGAQLEEYLSRSLQADPEYYWAHHGLGILYKNQGRYAEALAHLEWIVEHYVRETLPEEILINLAICHVRVGRAETAAELLQEASDRFPESPLAPFYLALVHLGEKREDEALAELRRSVARDEKFYRAYMPLVQIHHRRGDFAAAQRYRARARDLYHGNAIPELGNEFVIQLERIDGWTLAVTERLSSAADHPLEPGVWRYVADLLPEDASKDVRIRYVLRQTERFDHLVLRSVTDRAGGRHLSPVERIDVVSGDDYRAFYTLVTRDAPRLLERFGR